MFDRRTAPSDEIDVAEEEHVAWIRSQRDASLWHQAAMAALAAGVGFANDSIGLDPDFEPERLRALDVIARGEVAEGLIVPRALLDRPFLRERPENRFALDDGLLLLSD